MSRSPWQPERAGLRPKARHGSGTGVRARERGAGKHARASLEEAAPKVCSQTRRKLAKSKPSKTTFRPTPVSCGITERSLGLERWRGNELNTELGARYSTRWLRSGCPIRTAPGDSATGTGRSAICSGPCNNAGHRLQHVSKMRCRPGRGAFFSRNVFDNSTRPAC